MSTGHSVSEEFSDDQLWAFLRLEHHARDNVGLLMRARAWARLADLRPEAEKATQLIDLHLRSLEQAAAQRRIKERQDVAVAVAKYNEGMNSLEDLIGDLHDIAGVPDWRDD